jgi:hypothetical protein
LRQECFVPKSCLTEGKNRKISLFAKTNPMFEMTGLRAFKLQAGERPKRLGLDPGGARSPRVLHAMLIARAPRCLSLVGTAVQLVCFQLRFARSS